MWPLQHAALPDKSTDHKISQKRNISADEMYSTICVERAFYHLDVNRSTFDEKCAEN